MESHTHSHDDSKKDTDLRCNYDKREEGGSEAWLTVAGSFLVCYSSYGIINSFGFFQDFYQTEYLTSASPSTISIIGTLQIALVNVLSMISGGICDAHGIKYLYIFSGLGSSIGLLVLSFCPRGALWAIVLTQGLFMGVTFGAGVQPACVVTTHHFHQKRAMAMGLVLSGGSMGGVCYSLMFTQLQPQIGFPWTMRVAAVKVLISYSIALLISKAVPHRGETKRAKLIDFHGFLDMRYTVLALGACFANLGLWVPGFHIQTYASKVYPSSSIVSYLLPLMGSSSIPGAIIGGLLGDRVGRLNVLVLVAFLSGLLCLSLWLFEPTVYVLALFAVLFGFTSGGVISLLPPSVSQIVPEDKIGARMGAFYSVISIATLTGAPIGAVIVGKAPEKRNDYRGLIAFSGSALLIGSLVLLAARLLHNRDCKKW